VVECTEFDYKIFIIKKKFILNNVILNFDECRIFWKKTRCFECPEIDSS